MTWYQQQILSMTQALYPNQDLVEKVMQAKRYIDDHYASEMDLDRMAQEAWLSKFHFIRLFKKYYGRTPHIYLREVRLGEAKRLLRAGLPVKDVCLAVGFESVPSFTRLYKAICGRTPGLAISDKKNSC